MLNNELLLSGRSKFSISTNVSSGGSVSISPQGKQYAGTLMTVTCSPSSAYQFSSISIVKQDGTTVGYTTVTSGSRYTFIMPSGNVTVNVNYSLIPTYSISLSASGGSVSASKTSGIRAGERITLTLSPNAYYVLSSISTSPNVSLSGSGNTRTFTMPSSNVNVSVRFVVEYNFVIKVGYGKLGINSGYGYSSGDFGEVVSNTSGFRITSLVVTGYGINGASAYMGVNAYPRTVKRITEPRSSITISGDSWSNRVNDKNFLNESDVGKTIYFKVT